MNNFQFQNKYFKQNEGTDRIMGNLLIPFLTTIFMSRLEVISQFSKTPD